MGETSPKDRHPSAKPISQSWTIHLCLAVALSILAFAPATRYFGVTSDSRLQYTLSRFLVLDDALPGLLPSVAFALLAYSGTVLAVGACRDVFLQRGFKGKDLLKPGSNNEAIPESLGLPASCVYLLVLVLFIPFRYYFTSTDSSNAYQTTSRDGGWVGDMSGRSGFPHHELATYMSALLSLLSSQILGFCDDVFDIRWRFKMPIPLISSIPMLLVYYAGRGGTGLVIPGWPAWLRQLVGSNVIDLGVLYYVYMAMLSTFCTHSINILAGINGVEVGQALIIATSLCINDALYLPLRAVFSSQQLTAPLTTDGAHISKLSWLPWTSTTAAYTSPSLPIFNPIQNELISRHLFSISLLLPLIGTSAGLLAWNRYPSQVFVGDTFCYFAGQALACVGVLGHFSKTLLLFFIPQIFNFLLSCPQLFGFVPCPRHRVPKVYPENLALYPSIAVFSERKPAGVLGVAMLRILEVLRFIKVYRQGDLTDNVTGQEERIVATTNLTILNTILVLSGVRSPPEYIQWEIQRANHTEAQELASVTVSKPVGPHITEASLWNRMMIVQLIGSLIAFAIRYWAAAIVFPDQ
ncbi:unnamed protein product [Sympodiomycopsis kandeliae]